MSGSDAGGWVRFTRAWQWHHPKLKTRWTKTFRVGLETRLNRAQFQSALAAGVAISIPNPRHSVSEPETDHG